ncbi:hypothetical protein PsorP6_015213 [Peronosclerospora sorghi]|uniref:Uncharacterized protein n=1 Tax=Peronosclerospora sorghi TaxID=230839 RepID=A0ACC0VRP0_9STRA|nr:hypothetical protein PsorP6_015213 [Peronosclerospora sorghi]
MMEQYREHRTRVTDANLLTATTDADTAMRNPLRKLFPDTQLQLCKFHLNNNVALNISRKKLGREEGAARSSIARIGPSPTFQRRQEQRFRKSHRRIEPSVSTRETASEFQEEWDKMLVLFASQTEIVKYFNRQIKPTIRDWAHCFTRFNLNFGHRTTSPVESVNSMLKSYGLSANSTLDKKMKQYFDMVKDMERGYEEAIFKQGSNVLRDLVKKPEFTLFKSKVAWKAMRLANLQVLNIERHCRGEAVEFDKTSIGNGHCLRQRSPGEARKGEIRVQARRP